MEDYQVIYSGSLTTTNTDIYIAPTQNAGAIIKNIILYNTNPTNAKVTLTLDNTNFVFEINQGQTIFLDRVIYTKSMVASGDGVNIHVCGLLVS